MNLINDIYGQFTDLFKSMTPGARITTVLLALLVIVGAGYLFAYREGYADVALFGARDFANDDLSTMEKKFGRAGLNNFEIRGARVYVPRGKRAEYLRVLEGLTFRGNDPLKFKKDALNDTNPWTSQDTKKRKDLYYREMQVSDEIQSIPAVAKATVSVDHVTVGGLRRKTRATATVNVWGEGGQPISAQLAYSLRKKVASAFGHLDVTDVTVFDGNAGEAYDSDSINIGNDQYAKRKLHYEEDYRRKIQAQLSHIPGIRVQVEVELSEELLQDTTSFRVDPTRVGTLQSNNKTDSRTETRPGNQGNPGLAANSDDTTLAIRSTGGTESTVEKTDESTTSLPSRDVTSTRMAGLTPEKGKASIRVPMSYINDLWKKANPTAAEDATPDPQDVARLQQQEKLDIQEFVANLLPPESPGTTEHPHVSVTFYEDGFALADPVAPASTGVILAWLNENWKSIGMMGIAAFGIVMLRSMVKSSEEDTAPAPQQEEAPEPVVEQEDNEEVEDPDSVLDTFEGGPDLREELLHLVQADPDGAVNKLRSWLSEVG